MVTYKISKGYSNAEWNRHKCDSRFGCWDLKVKVVKVYSNVNCNCCKDGHKETFYMCDSHIKDLKKFLPKTTSIELKWEDINDPVLKLFKPLTKEV